MPFLPLPSFTLHQLPYDSTTGWKRSKDAKAISDLKRFYPFELWQKQDIPTVTLFWQSASLQSLLSPSLLPHNLKRHA